MELLTTGEAAAYLRLKERKIYELVAEGAIPCTKATGRWLFPRDDLDRWLRAGQNGAAVLRPVPPPIVGGSQDPLLDWALRECGGGLASLPEGSEAGLRRLTETGVVAAAIHLHGEGDDSNRARLQRLGDPALVLVGFARREQGLLTAPGNPLGLASIADAVARGARFALRPEGAGAQQLLSLLLAQAGSRVETLGDLGIVCRTGPDLAQAIRAGRADCGVATRAVADAAGLGFAPIQWERFDLVMRQADYFRPPLQALLALMRDPRFARQARELGGYDVSGAGGIRWAG